MPRTSHTPVADTEEQLVALLATLRVTTTEEADFEGRFLSEFHDRVARETVCCPARRRLFAHLMQLIDNFGRGRLAFGASGAETSASVVAELQKSPLVLPVLSNDLAECTTIRVEPGQSAFEVGGVTVRRGQHSTVIEVPNTTVISVPQRQGNFISLPAPSVRYAF